MHELIHLQMICTLYTSKDYLNSKKLLSITFRPRTSNYPRKSFDIPLLISYK